jgi:predicted transcriptional regulator of viral defense system
MLSFPGRFAHMAEPIQDAPDHRELYLIAEQQAGYFSASQARRVGFSRSLLSYHHSTGRFARVRSGVYRLAQFPASSHEDLHIACLQVGPEAVISHDSALALYELSDLLPAEVHVTARRSASRRQPGIRLHTNRLRHEDVTRYEGLPVTTVQRTLADVAAAGLADDQVRQAIQEALRRGLVTRESLLSTAAQRGGRFRRLVDKAWRDEGIA